MFDKDKFYLGKLCKNNHPYKKDNQSLRYKSTRNCIECAKTYGKIQKDKFINSKPHESNPYQFLGILCKNNHEYKNTGKSLRYLKMGGCVKCHREINKDYIENNQKHLLKYQKDYYKENKEKVRQNHKEYYQKNLEHRREHIRNYTKENKEKRQIYNKKYWKETIEKEKITPILKINRIMRSALRRGLLNNIKNKKIFQDYTFEELLGYTFEDLKKHLEKLFLPEMSWENHGDWHIDHIIPISQFNYTNPLDPEFKICWSLENFQPLWASDNLSKNNKTMEEWIEWKNLKNQQ